MSLDFFIKNQFIIFTILGIIVFLLGCYLGYLFVHLKKQKIEKEKAQESVQRTIREKNLFYIDSIITISRACIQGQCELSEACIRIKKLLEYYPEIEKDNNYAAIQLMYEEIKVFATHGERSELSKQEVYTQDKQRFVIENKYKDSLDKSLKVLLQQFESLR